MIINVFIVKARNITLHKYNVFAFYLPDKTDYREFNEIINDTLFEFYGYNDLVNDGELTELTAYKNFINETEIETENAGTIEAVYVDPYIVIC